MTTLVAICGYNRIDAIWRTVRDAIKSFKDDRFTITLFLDHSEYQSEIKRCMHEAFGDSISIICQPKNLGLKAHMYFIMEKSLTYDYLVLLEDDLLISPAAGYFCSGILGTKILFEKDVACVSTYSWEVCESSLMKFTPLHYKNFYAAKVVSSWGAIYSRKIISEFLNERGKYSPDLPANIKRWSVKSWKKEFLEFILHRGLYVVYPNFSTTTNPAIAGEHHKSKLPGLNSTLSLSVPDFYEINFAELPKYNAWLEIENSLYLGIERREKVTSNFRMHTDLLTPGSLLLGPAIFSQGSAKWDNAIRPAEANVLLENGGTDIGLYRVEPSISNFAKLAFYVCINASHGNFKSIIRRLLDVFIMWWIKK